MNKTSKYKKADLIGILSSSICLVHCIATPLLVIYGIGFSTNPIFKYLFLIISFVSIFKATENSTNYKISILLWLSFFGFLFSNFFHEEYHWLDYFEYLFAVLIIFGHVLNIKHCKHCKSHN
jgi:hypothetical protein